MDRPAPTILARPANDVAGSVHLSEAAAGLVRHQNCSEFLAVLDRERLYPDALRFAAAALPKPHALWWGCLCAWEAYRPTPAPKAQAALAAVVHWLQRPDEERRRAAEKAADVAGADTPAGGLALAVFLSGGSISLPNLPAVEPAPGLFARTLATAVFLASTACGPAETAARQRQLVALVGDVVTGRSHWTA